MAFFTSPHGSGARKADTLEEKERRRKAERSHLGRVGDDGDNPPWRSYMIFAEESTESDFRLSREGRYIGRSYENEFEQI